MSSVRSARLKNLPIGQTNPQRKEFVAPMNHFATDLKATQKPHLNFQAHSGAHRVIIPQQAIIQASKTLDKQHISPAK